ncbi:MerR family transcriptional regulator/heat shock protein HspR [Micrococcus luteus]|uniref:heat shock protein transcriptional repressor HspR n=1 Tax=Micrococcus luteus TaxID=1270 RepID=UPI0012F3CF6B|nr:MerR family transcriptional regulator [Micrococcus luteus]VWX50344.1 MerR family transcriptional regulator/heat shock protein HspR [Micrococcus luteus]
MSARDGAARADRGREPGLDRNAPVFVISVAAEMADMHPQTLRQYDRLGLVVPARQGGRQRRYSLADVERLQTVQALSREGISLEGIRRVIALQREVEQLQDTVVELAAQVNRLHHASRLARVFTVGSGGDVSARYADRMAARRQAAARTEADAAGQASPGVLRTLPSGGARPRRVLTWQPEQD